MEWWLKKYEPQSLVNLIDHENVIEQLQEFVQKSNFPHLLISGPPGSGRLTAVQGFLRDLYGSDYQNHILLLNAFDRKEYLIEKNPHFYDLARKARKRIGQTSIEPTLMEVFFSIFRNFPKLRAFSDVPFRTLVLYDADGFTRMAQQALRRVMETSTHTFRMIIVCNNVSRIIEPIRSRCISISFKKFRDESIFQVLRYIAEKEGIILPDDALRVIPYVNDNHMGQCINLLQAVASMKDPITSDLVLEISKKVLPKMKMIKLIHETMQGNFQEARKQMRDLLRKNRLSGRRFLKLFYDTLMSEPLHEDWKISLALILAEIDSNLQSGNSEDIQLAVLLARISHLFQIGISA